MSAWDGGLYRDGTTGWSGSDTSAERAVRETLSPRRKQVYDLVAASGATGMMVGEVEDALGVGHGAASSALTVLHRGGYITRLKERRARQEVYVVPQHVNGREESPYRPNTGEARIVELEAEKQRAEQRAEELRAAVRWQADVIESYKRIVSAIPIEMIQAALARVRQERAES